MMDACSPEDQETVVELLKEAFADQGIEVFAISAVSGQGLKQLLYHVSGLLEKCPKEVTVYEPEFDPSLRMFEDEPVSVYLNEDDEYVIEGPRIEKMLGYTNLESEKGFLFFQKFMKEQGILDQLEEMGIEEGDTVRVYELAFEYLK